MLEMSDCGKGNSNTFTTLLVSLELERHLRRFKQHNKQTIFIVVTSLTKLTLQTQLAELEEFNITLSLQST